MSKRHRAINGRWYRKARVARARTRELQIAFVGTVFLKKRIRASFTRQFRR